VPGTPTNYDVTRLQQGPGDLWVIGGGVPDSTTPQLTLVGALPDSTAYPSSVHLGAWPEGQMASVASKPKFADVKMDQMDAPVGQFLVGQECSIEVELAQMDPAIIQNCAPYAVYSTAAGPPGYRQLTFGGATNGIITPVCIALISQKRGVAGKYLVTILFNAIGTMGWQTSMGRSKQSTYKASFKGMADPTRTAGRQIGVFYETL
jgi:hypothetical protein